MTWTDCLHFGKKDLDGQGTCISEAEHLKERKVIIVCQVGFDVEADTIFPTPT